MLVSNVLSNIEYFFVFSVCIPFLLVYAYLSDISINVASLIVTIALVLEMKHGALSEEGECCQEI